MATMQAKAQGEEKTSNKRDVFGFFRNIDIFGEPVPSFNIDGKTTVKTAIGACISLVIMMLALSFGLLKM